MPFFPSTSLTDLLADLKRTLDLLDAYKNIPLERIQAIPGIDFHPNEIAHRITAERLYSWLRENSYLPEDLWIKNLYKDRTQVHVEHEPKAENNSAIFKS
ncbi:MAG: hypothetical protein R3A13_00495 [Bdellovibrionota bacterium]